MRGVIAALWLTVPAVAFGEPATFKSIQVDGIQFAWHDYMSATPNSTATNNLMNTASSFLITAYEDGTVLVSPTYVMAFCMNDGVLETPKFAYKTGETSSDSYKCKINDGTQKGSFTNTIKGKSSFENGILSIDGSVVQKGTAKFSFDTGWFSRKLSAKETQKVVIAINGDKCTLKSLKMSGEATWNVPADSGHYAYQTRKRLVMKVTSKAACKVY